MVAVYAPAKALAWREGCAESLSSILADRKNKSRLVNPVRIVGISDKAGEVKRPCPDVERAVDLGPTLAGVIRAIQRGVVLGLYDGIDTGVLGRWDRESNPPQVTLRQTFSEFV